MAGETVITIVGNLTADPELRTIGSGATVASFTIASTPRTWNRQTNQFEDGQALFMRCSAWRDLADTHLTPREVIRDFIELLDILCQNPDADVAELLQSVGGDTLAPANESPTSSDDRNFAEFTI